MSADDPNDLKFEPLSPAVLRDPYPFYDRFRALAPIYKTQFGAWFLTRYEDVALVLRDRRFGKDFTKGRPPETLQEPVHVAMSRMMIYLNPPDHTRVRGLVAQAFAGKRVEEMRAEVQQVADELIDKVEQQGQMDLVRDFAFALPLTVICRMLGISAEDQATVFADYRISGRALDAAPLTRKELDQSNARTKYMEEYFLRLFDLRRRQPGTDLTTRLVEAQQEGEAISVQELISNVLLLFGAGHETTASLIGNAVVALHRHPEQLQRIKRDPALLSSALDELMRYDTSVQFGARTALDDVVLDSVQIKKGDVVLASLGAANRDPALYEEPHRLDLARQNVRHLAFGAGVHFCLGAQLARLELEVALATLLHRLPGLHLNDLDRLQWRPNFLFRGLETLPVSW